jgi:2-iminobutanoate/2-iminopropanoate deaminase
MKMISTPNGPTPAGHYSQAVVYAGVVYVAGQLGRAPDAAEGDDPGGAAEQTRQALANVAAVLDAAGSGLERVVQMTVYVTDISLWGEVNEVYAEVMGDHKPARAIVPVKEFAAPYVIEIVAVAALA